MTTKSIGSYKLDPKTGRLERVKKRASTIQRIKERNSKRVRVTKRNKTAQAP